MTRRRTGLAAAVALVALLSGGTEARSNPLNTHFLSVLQVVSPTLTFMLLQNASFLQLALTDPALAELLGRGALPFQNSADAGTTGLSSGDSGIRFGTWANAGWTGFDNDLASTRYDGDAYSANAGLHALVADGLVVGVAAGHDGVDLDSAFNNGGLQSRGGSVGPYFALALGQHLILGGSVGYAWGGIDLDRIDPQFGNRITAETDYSSLFGNLQLEAAGTIDGWRLAGRLGLGWGRTDLDAYTESNGAPVAAAERDEAVLQAGVEIGHAFDAIFPYAGVTYRYRLDLDPILVAPNQPRPANDADDFVLRAGFAVPIATDVSAGLEASRTVGNQDRDEAAVRLGLWFVF